MLPLHQLRLVYLLPLRPFLVLTLLLLNQPAQVLLSLVHLLSPVIQLQTLVQFLPRRPLLQLLLHCLLLVQSLVLILPQFLLLQTVALQLKVPPFRLQLAALFLPVFHQSLLQLVLQSLVVVSLFKLLVQPLVSPVCLLPLPLLQPVISPSH